MSTEPQKFATSDVISIPFGLRLKSAREARGLESKDVAVQLRLSEKMIVMIERETYPTDLPVTFVRGYIRAYARLMEISDAEIAKALEPIKLEVTSEEEHELIEPLPVTSSNYFIQFFTYLILLTIVSLVGVWWYSESASDNRSITTTEVAISRPDGAKAPINAGANQTATLSPSVAHPAETLAPQSNNAESATNSSQSLATQLIVNGYAMQWMTRLILFLFIGFVIMWWQKREIKKTARIYLSLMLLSFISLLGLWWYHYSQWVSVSPSTSQNENRKPHQTLQSSNPSLKTETPVVSLPTQEIVAPNQAAPLSQEKKDQSSHIQNTSETLTNHLLASPDKANSTSFIISSEKYTPVPHERKKTAKTKRKNVVYQPKPVPVNEFSELDE